jgi:hypothetical protein
MDNNGGVDAHSNTVGLNNIAGLTVNGGLNRTVPSIEAGGRQSTDYSITTTGLGAGTHWIPVQFVSNSYAESYSFSTALGVSLIVETTPPVGNCTGAPTYASGQPISLNFSATDTQTGTFSYTPAAGDGIYRFAVRSLDQGGTYEAIPTSQECVTTVDSATPTSLVSSPAQDLGGSIPLTYSVTDPSPSSGLSFVDFWYRETNNDNWTYTGQFATSFNGVVNFTPPGDGTYHFISRAKDNASNIELIAPFGSPGETTTVYDTLAPTGTVLINGGAASTSNPIVTLTLTGIDAGSGVQQMRFSNDFSTWSGYQPYASTVAGFDLASLGGDVTPGVKKVYVQLRDGVGRVSDIFTDTINLVGGTDTDGDGVLDASDNCTLEPNADQRDTNGDGYGNLCDTDLNNDGVTNATDLALFRAVFFQSGDLDADFNGDGIVNTGDLGILRARFFQAPGPSGIAP